MRIITLVVILALVGSQCVGQNLLERTKLGLSCQSTLEPNHLSKEVSNLKSSSTVELFSWDNRKSTNPQDEVSLLLNRKQLIQLTLDPEASLQIDIPVTSSQGFKVKLVPFKVQSEGGKLLTPEGAIPSTNKMQFYRGIIDGDHGSLVTASIVNGDLQMSISDQDGIYRISPSNYKSNNYSIWIDSSLTENEFTCGTDESHQLEKHPDINITPEKGSNEKAAGDIVQVYVECDNELRSDQGGVSGTEAFVAQLFAEIITLYANENINMEVSDIFVWTSPDPYAGNENLGTVLSQFGANRRDNYNGRIATLLKGDLSSNQFGCGVSGLAWVDVLCSNFNSFGNSGPYNVNRGIGHCRLNANPTVSRDALDVSVVAHEIGHNMGSPHTYACAWGPNRNQIIDICPGLNSGCSLITSPTPTSESGTIMTCGSNLKTFSRGFGTEPGNLIRNRVAVASCLVTKGNGSNNGGSSHQDPCTHDTRIYNGGFIFSTEVKANNSIILRQAVTVLGNANIEWQAENQFEVFGTLTIPAGAEVNVIAEDCN